MSFKHCVYSGSDYETHCLSVGNLTLQVIFREGYEKEVYYYQGQILSEHLTEYMKENIIKYSDFYCLKARELTQNISDIVNKLQYY